MKPDIHTIEAQTAGSVELAEHIFGLEPRADILHRVVQWQLNKRQQGTHQAKSRGEINRTTAEARTARRAAARPVTVRARPASSSAAARPSVRASAATKPR